MPRVGCLLLCTVLLGGVSESIPAQEPGAGVTVDRVARTISIDCKIAPRKINDEKFKESYLAEFPGYYKTADAGYKDEDGYVYVLGRTDDIINVAGHRLSTGGMEEVLSSHADVAECAVIGVADQMKGEVPVGFVVLKAGVNKPHDTVEKELIALVREKIGPVAAFKTAMVIARLPKTRSGKIVRGTMKKIADREPWNMPATIDDPAILDEIKTALQGKGMAAE